MKNQFIGWGIVFLLLVFSDCTKDTGYYEEEIPEGSIIMRTSTPQRVSDQMILEIVAIHDSRCPIGAVCTTDGAVIIDFKAFIASEFKEFSVTYYEKKESITSFEKHLIEVISVTPYPYLNQPIDNLEDYSIKIEVEKVV